MPKKKLFERREANPNPWIKNTAQGETTPYIARIHFNPTRLGPIASQCPYLLRKDHKMAIIVDFLL